MGRCRTSGGNSSGRSHRHEDRTLFPQIPNAATPEYGLNSNKREVSNPSLGGTPLAIPWSTYMLGLGNWRLRRASCRGALLIPLCAPVIVHLQETHVCRLIGSVLFVPAPGPLMQISTGICFSLIRCFAYEFPWP